MHMNRQAARELAGVVQTTSADFMHITESQRVLDEQFHILLQMMEEAEPSADTFAISPSNNAARRGRGAEKKYYLADDTAHHEPFVGALVSVINAHYKSAQFAVNADLQLKAPTFLALIFDLGIKHGLSYEGAPVKDFANLVSEAVARSNHANSIQTAYGTIQKVTRKWRELLPPSFCLMSTIHLSGIAPTMVTPAAESDYNRWLSLHEAVEKIYVRYFGI